VYDRSRLLSFSSENIKHVSLISRSMKGLNHDILLVAKSSCHVTSRSIMDLRWATQQVYGPKNTFSKLMGLSDTFLQVDGPLVHFTLLYKSNVLVTFGNGNCEQWDCKLDIPKTCCMLHSCMLFVLIIFCQIFFLAIIFNWQLNIRDQAWYLCLSSDLPSRTKIVYVFLLIHSIPTSVPYCFTAFVCDYCL
jgi:hypothetical protein